MSSCVWLTNADEATARPEAELVRVRAEAAAAPEQQAVVHQRYCHVYREGELRRLVESVPGASVVQEYYDTGNHCVLVRKGGEAEEASSCSG